MLVRRLLLAATLWTLTGSVGAVRFSPSLGLGFRNEPGVETKGLLMAGGRLGVGYLAWVWGNLALSAGDNPGIAQYGLGADALLIRSAGLMLKVQANHSQWSSWQVGENSLSGMVLALPLRRLELGIGLAWRSPQLDPAHYLSPFRFTGPADELNLLYHVNWSFLEMRKARLCFWVADDDAVLPHAAQQLPFGLEGELVTWPSESGRYWLLTARLGSSIKGLSGALFSLGGLEARIGVSYGR
jgi:hypothetical protein